MLWLPTSEGGIDGNFLEVLDDVRGEEFTDDGLIGDDLDVEDFAWEARGFRRVDMVTWLL